VLLKLESGLFVYFTCCSNNPNGLHNNHTAADR